MRLPGLRRAVSGTVVEREILRAVRGAAPTGISSAGAAKIFGAEKAARTAGGRKSTGGQPVPGVPVLEGDERHECFCLSLLRGNGQEPDAQREQVPFAGTQKEGDGVKREGQAKDKRYEI